jgi:glycosyltransferase involved in cell wall biosynthesis
MMRVSCILPPLPYSGPATQAALLAPALLQVGITLETVPVDTGLFRRLLELRRSQGEVIHLVGLTALRRFLLAGQFVKHSPIVQSLNGHERLTRWDRWLLRSVSRIVVTFPTAVESLAAQGVERQKMTVIPPAVVEPTPRQNRADFLRSQQLPAEALVLMASGSMHRPTELTDAIWAYEVMRYTSDRFYLFVFGDGPERARVETFARNLAPEGTRVRFLGLRKDVRQLLSCADIVLVTPSVGGLTFALEAMNAGRPVVAHDTPQLASVLQSGVNGILIPKGNHPAAAKALTKIVDDPPFRERISKAAKETAQQYTVERAVRAWQTVYSLPTIERTTR